MKAKVLTDSGSGLSAKQASDLGIAFLPLQVTVDNQQYLDGINLDIPELYKMLDEGKMPSTSQPPLLMQEELLKIFKRWIYGSDSDQSFKWTFRNQCNITGDCSPPGTECSYS